MEAELVDLTTTNVPASGNLNPSTDSPTEIAPTCPINPTPTQNKRVKPNKSAVWHHFKTVIDEDGHRHAICNYCEKSYAADTKIHGTSNLNAHVIVCPKYPNREPPAGQTQLVFKHKLAGGSGGLVPFIFSVEKATKALSEMVILDELPFKFVEGIGFKKFCEVLQPKFKVIPSRCTVARNCMKLYAGEKDKLKKLLRGVRICMTSDTWTSNQNLNYMCLTVHFIDANWVMHKRIISFCMVEDHKGDTIGRKVDNILRDWNIDACFTLTLDNASSNNVAIKYLVEIARNRPKTISNHEYLHVRCSAHILNLIVREGLVELESSINKIRDVVRYVRSSPSRFLSFKSCVAICGVQSKSLLCLDVSTRWNSTYRMLESAEKFETVFERLLLEDRKFSEYFFSDDKSLPTCSDWKNARCFVEFLRLFYNSTKKFSGTLFVTSNLFFDEIVVIWEKIQELCGSDDVPMKDMAAKMKLKFLKYWGGDSVNILLYIAVVLDPRKKLQYLECYFSVMYGEVKAGALMLKVNSALGNLFSFYVSSDSDVAASTSSTSSDNATTVGQVDPLASRFKNFMASKHPSRGKTELQRYLGEEIEPLSTNFDILCWWKANSVRFKMLSNMAKDVLAVPVSTVASESTFSTGGRVLDNFRSSLSPKTVEALICSQNWLKSSDPFSLTKIMAEVEEIQGELGCYEMNDDEGGNGKCSKAS